MYNESIYLTIHLYATDRGVQANFIETPIIGPEKYYVSEEFFSSTECLDHVSSSVDARLFRWLADLELTRIPGVTGLG